MTPVTDLVLAERDGGTLVLSLNRPAQRNPLDHATVRCLLEQAAAADTDADVRAVIITGRGSAFSAGGDLRGYLSLFRDEAAFRAFLDDFARLNTLLERGAFVSIAMVNGACVAGGLELLLACDLAVAAEDCRIGDGHARTGQLPGAGSSQRLWRAVGARRARDLLLTGRLLSGTEAAAIGLVARAVPAGELAATTTALAEEIGAHSPLLVHRMKELACFAEEHGLDEGLAHERDVVARYATTSHDATEGLHAFLERRPAQWRGE